MNQASFDDPNDFRHKNRLTEYFRQLDEERASNANESPEGDEAEAAKVAENDNGEFEGVWTEGERAVSDGDGSIGEIEERYFPEDMLTPQFFEPCFRSHLSGNLRAFLSVLGLGDDDNVARVQSLLEQRAPTIWDESDHLFVLIEQELAQMCLGGATRVGDFTEDGFALDAKVEERRLKAMELLAFVRVKRLELRSRRSD